MSKLLQDPDNSNRSAYLAEIMRGFYKVQPLFPEMKRLNKKMALLEKEMLDSSKQMEGHATMGGVRNTIQCVQIETETKLAC
jgi:hypothetical protein